jgi:hypothetical protein
MKEFGQPDSLNLTLAAETGANAGLTKKTATQAVILLGKIAVRTEATTIREMAAGWGREFLQAVGEHPVDLSDQTSRYEALLELTGIASSPTPVATEAALPPQASCLSMPLASGSSGPTGSGRTSAARSPACRRSRSRSGCCSRTGSATARPARSTPGDPRSARRVPSSCSSPSTWSLRIGRRAMSRDLLVSAGSRPSARATRTRAEGSTSGYSRSARGTPAWSAAPPASAIASAAPRHVAARRAPAAPATSTGSQPGSGRHTSRRWTSRPRSSGTSRAVRHDDPDVLRTARRR